jgi:DEAD/DEAH box helicase domain-containing protein
VDATVGRIDGNVPPGIRLNVLERSRVVVFTPDILHAWLFSNMNAPACSNSWRIPPWWWWMNSTLITACSVQCGFLFRRLQHVLGLLGSRRCGLGLRLQLRSHNSILPAFGLHFELIGAEMDTSPRHRWRCCWWILPPNKGAGRSGAFVGRFGQPAEIALHTFVDSRQQWN